MFSAGISADLEFRVDRSKRYNFYRDRRKQGDFAETVENATKQGDRTNPALRIYNPRTLEDSKLTSHRIDSFHDDFVNQGLCGLPVL